jgi:hypothetical protein
VLEPPPLSPKQSRPAPWPEPSKSESVGRAHVQAAMTFRDPGRPTRPLPRLLRRLIPDELQALSLADHSDIAAMSAAERRREAFKIRVAIALVDDDARIPSWLLERLRRLRP